MSELKFGGQPVLGRLMADLARPAFRDFVASTAPPAEVFATWVPSHKSAKRERGYNQAEILARELASGPPLLSCAELVAKTAGTAHQKGLGRADRLSNLRGAFSPRPDIEKRISSSVIGSPRMGSSGLRHGKGRQGTGSVLRYSAIILVDDVYTTGATAAAVSSVLASHTGLPVHVFTFSRAVAPRGQGHD
ncbi:MAG: hypothetical protein M1274_00225 [Actinobacteria bacterium]|nr:hypothetical protein [Actinomycetota bacterium]